MRKTWKPELCHGIGKSRFEGWYYKLVDHNEKAAIAIIPGFSSAHPRHAFIQIFNGITGDYQYNTFSLNEFRYTNNRFELFISKNYFSSDLIKLNLNTQDFTFNGELTFKNQVPWPIKFLSPGAMGPFAFLPRMECSHAVLSFDHEIYGNLNINGEEYSFDHGRGYIEKDWGRSFPSGYVWMQSNHFPEQEVSFMASIARIPYLGRSFTGFLAGFLYRNKLYLFSTYNRAKLKDLTINGNQVSFKLVKKNQVVEIEAIQTKPSHLKGPIKGKMVGKVLESLTSTIDLRFIDSKNNIEFNGIGNLSGMEIMAKEKDLQ
ncbi:MAG: tocopherol cyclase family protein [Candidatus Hodarchaeales archaeon]